MPNTIIYDKEILMAREAVKTYQLSEKFGGHWEVHPDHPLDDWKYEVANNDTKLGYWNWVFFPIAGKIKERRL